MVEERLWEEHAGGVDEQGDVGPFTLDASDECSPRRGIRDVARMGDDVTELAELGSRVGEAGTVARDERDAAAALEDELRRHLAHAAAASDDERAAAGELSGRRVWHGHVLDARVMVKPT
jgi:hypothetical protein